MYHLTIRRINDNKYLYLDLVSEGNVIAQFSDFPLLAIEDYDYYEAFKQGCYILLDVGHSLLDYEFVVKSFDDGD